MEVNLKLNFTYSPGSHNFPPTPCCYSSHELWSWRWGFGPRGCRPCPAWGRGSVSIGKKPWEKGRGGRVGTDHSCRGIGDFGIPSISRRINHWIAFGKIGRPLKSLRSSTYGFERDVWDLWLWLSGDEMTWKTHQKINSRFSPNFLSCENCRCIVLTGDQATLGCVVNKQKFRLWKLWRNTSVLWM